MKRAQIVLGVTAFTLGIFLVGPRVRATESEDVVTNGNVAGEHFEGARLSLPFQTNRNFSLAAVTESSTEADEADKLAKQLANPISSLISVPFQANEDWGYGPTGNGYKFTLNIQPVGPLSISKDWNLIIRTIFPIKGFGHGFLLAAGVLRVKFSDQSPCVPKSSKRRAMAQRADRIADFGNIRRDEISRNQESMRLNFQFPLRGITPASRLDCSTTTTKTNLTI